MWVEAYRLAQFRQFRELSLKPGFGLNFFAGDNASGKTTLLEGLSVLARGRSFRSVRLQELTRRPGEGGWRVEVGSTGVTGLPERWRVCYEQRQLRYECGDQVIGKAEVAKQWPVLFLLPTSHRLIDDAPMARRGLLDWALFHVEPHFLTEWRGYQRALRQRNEGLRAGASTEVLQPWTLLLAASGERIDALRRRLVHDLMPYVTRELDALWPGLQLELSLQSGWDGTASLLDALQAQAAVDRRLRFTHSGPHRGELGLKVIGGAARTVLSRGQQKIVVAAILFGIASVLHARRGLWAPLMIDDWNSEMGDGLSQRLWSRVVRYAGQRWVTGFSAPPWAHQQIDHLFHVEQGTVTQC